ncbi:unnamed protein product [Somion occarium]|uniref:Uncharacterized protein n=1 Tax=Somion occarium TaxID=3059160 RepID=A0ABP1CP98_9APHY
MAARRLAISSLLCEDDSVGGPVAGPSSTSISSRPSLEFVESDLSYSTTSRQDVDHRNSIPSSTYLSGASSDRSSSTQSTALVRPPGPIPRQNEGGGSYSSLRKGGTETDVDDEHGMIDASRTDSVTTNYVVATNRHSRRQWSPFDAQPYSPEDSYHNHTPFQRSTECSYTTFRSSSSSGQRVSPGGYARSRSPAQLVHPPSLSPTQLVTPPVPLTAQYRRTSASDVQYSRPHRHVSFQTYSCSSFFFRRYFFIFYVAYLYTAAFVPASFSDTLSLLSSCEDTFAVNVTTSSISISDNIQITIGGIWTVGSTGAGSDGGAKKVEWRLAHCGLAGYGIRDKSSVKSCSRKSRPCSCTITFILFAFA